MAGEETIDNPNNAEYSSKSDFSKADVVRIQVLKCDEVRSQEMKAGYHNYNEHGNKVYIPDSRQEWVASVKALLYLLNPEVKRNNFVERIGLILAKEKEAIELYGLHPMVSNGKEIITYDKLPKIIPRLDQVFPVENIITNKQGGIININIKPEWGKYNNNFHNYWHLMVIIYDELYKQLNDLIDVCNYFKQKVSY